MHTDRCRVGTGLADVVYFTRDGVTLGKTALKVRVGLKEKESPRTVCYLLRSHRREHQGGDRADGPEHRGGID